MNGSVDCNWRRPRLIGDGRASLIGPSHNRAPHRMSLESAPIQTLPGTRITLKLVNSSFACQWRVPIARELACARLQSVRMLNQFRTLKLDSPHSKKKLNPRALNYLSTRFQFWNSKVMRTRAVTKDLRRKRTIRIWFQQSQSGDGGV
jgi:hypothetical protein